MSAKWTVLTSPVGGCGYVSGPSYIGPHPIVSERQGPLDMEADMSSDGDIITTMASGRVIIVLTGRAGSGKSTIAKEIARMYGAHVTSFATPLKEMLIALGLHYCDVYGDNREMPCALLGGQTPRHAMQTLGTEWGRNLIHPDLWCMVWRERVNRLDGVVVVDDCRFSNEVEAAHDVGRAVVFRLNRGHLWRGGFVQATHISESLAVDYDHLIENDREPHVVAADVYARAYDAEIDERTKNIIGVVLTTPVDRRSRRSANLEREMLDYYVGEWEK
jgi:tRNA A37 threonylcarbamoyladenosine biosynthesis protein TsaE